MKQTCAVIGDAKLAAEFERVLRAKGAQVLDTSTLVVQEEWQVRRWFVEHQPTHVVVCMGNQTFGSLGNFSVSVTGTIHVLAAALGFAKKVRVISQWATAEFFLMMRLTELYRLKKEVDYLSVISSPREADFVTRCVLELQDVASKETNTQSATSTLQGGEVHNEVLSQPAGQEVQRVPAEHVLEVPVAPVQGEQAPHVCPQCDPAKGQAT